MFETVYFCGFRVWKLACSVAIIGIFNSLFTSVSMFISWFCIPLSVAIFLAHVCVLIGVKYKRLSYLCFAEMILGINAFINVILEVATVCIEIFVPNDEIISFIDDYGSCWVEKNLHVTFMITDFIILLQFVFTVFSFIIVHKTRLYFTFTYPYGYYCTPKKQISHCSKSSSIQSFDKP